jgi:hypothetical protein
MPLNESKNGLMGMGEKKVVVKYVGKESLWISKSKHLGRCALQNHYNENGMEKHRLQ